LPPDGLAGSGSPTQAIPNIETILTILIPTYRGRLSANQQVRSAETSGTSETLAPLTAVHAPPVASQSAGRQRVKFTMPWN
jgi:hypothetical protein